jgi:tRNA (guanine37-N1)-methyltransferase
MRIDILTLFPQVFPAYLQASIVQRAQAAGLMDVRLHDIRDHGVGRHHITDEPPYGGGGGMVLKPEPVFAAVEAVLGQSAGEDRDGTRPPIILLTPQGRLFNHAVARELAGYERLILICGRYEGVDERVREHLATDELSIGDYVLTGGELAALVVVDAITRLIPGALGAEGAAETDSHAAGVLEGPHYTRPETFQGWTVPEVLRSGHAAQIARWRRQEALRRTWLRRPELLLEAPLEADDRQFLATLAEELAGERAAQALAPPIDRPRGG